MKYALEMAASWSWFQSHAKDGHLVQTVIAMNSCLASEVSTLSWLMQSSLPSSLL
jgi:hypothetical protein